MDKLDYVVRTSHGTKRGGILTIEVQRRTKHGAPGVLRPAHDTVVTATARHAYNILLSEMLKLLMMKFLPAGL